MVGLAVGLAVGDLGVLATLHSPMRALVSLVLNRFVIEANLINPAQMIINKHHGVFFFKRVLAFNVLVKLYVLLL